MIGKTVSHYRILSKLGAGGMGTVYVAEDTVLGRQVAIKSINVPATPAQKNFRARFLREARAASLLNHPHIATVHDYGETEDGQPYLVMELVNGESLSDLLQREAISPERTVAIIKQVTEAIAEAHRHGIIHRDIKPSNIALNQRNEVKVLDFGLAKYIVSDDLKTKRIGEDPQASDDGPQPTLQLSATQTLEGVIVGTPSYLSPEQALGKPVDKRSDLFAIGSLLYECLTGSPVFIGQSVGDIFARVIRDNPPPPSQLNPRVSRALDRVTLKALAKKPEERYQTAEELLADLNNIGSKLTTTQDNSLIAQLRTSIPQLLTPKRIAILSIATLLLALAALWFSTRRSAVHQPSPAAMRLYRAGTDALRNGSFLKASSSFEQAIQADAQFPLAHARLAEVWFELDYEGKATEEMLRVTELAPNLSALPPLDMLHVQAISATLRRNSQGAVENFEEIVRQTSESDKSFAYFDLGRAYERARDVDRAINAYEEVARRNPQSAAAFLRLGGLYGRKQDQQKTLSAFDKAQALYDAQSNDEGRAEVFYQRGAYFSVIDKLSDAQEQFRRGLDLAMTSDNKPQQIKTLLQLSGVLYSTGESLRAEEYATRAIELARAEKLDNLTTAGLVEIGNAFFLRGDYSAAEKRFEQALQISQANKARRGEARALLSLGSLFVQQGMGGKALPYLEPALAFYRQGNFRRETLQALLLLGNASEQQGNNEAALESFNEQLRLAEEVNDTAQLAHTYSAIGVLLTHQERFTEALEYFDKSYRLNKSLGLEPKTGYDLLNRGNLLWQLGHYKEARDTLNEAFAAANRVGGVDKQLLGWVYLFRARMALSESLYSEAITQSRKAIALGGTQDLSVQVAYTQGLAELNTGITRAGIAKCQQAFDTATQAGEPRLIANAQLALAEALLSTDAAKSLTAALQAQQIFARLGSRHSEWRAWLIAAQASRRQQDTTKVDEYATYASGLLTTLERNWGTSEYNSYLSRPDVQRYRKQLDELLPGANR